MNVKQLKDALNGLDEGIDVYFFTGDGFIVPVEDVEQTVRETQREEIESCIFLSAKGFGRELPPTKVGGFPGGLFINMIQHIPMVIQLERHDPCAGNEQPSKRLTSEIEKLSSMSPFNYFLSVHNKIGKSINPKFFDREILVGDTRNVFLSGGGWIDIKGKKAYIVYDIDFIRNLYTNEDKRDVVLSSWSLIGHEMGHVKGEIDKKIFPSEESDENYANDKMKEFMKNKKFSKCEVYEGYGKYYEVFYKGRDRERKDITDRDGLGTRTNLEKSWGPYKKCENVNRDGSCKLRGK